AGEGKKEMPAMDHSKMNMSGSDAGKEDMSAMDHSKMNMQGMDHGSMQMQGGSAPSDARDPHGYSDGYTLDSGEYSLGPQNRLRMSDEHNFASVLFDRFEYVKSGSSEGLAYEAQAWFGGTYDRAVLKAEGEIESGKLQEAQTELLWGHAVSTFWDTQLGVRFDHGEGPKRQWLAFGVQGLSPYWFDIDATAYVGSGGRTALSLSAEYELLITQKLVLQPRAEVNFYGKKDEAREIGSGLSDGTAGLRLKYEVNRQFVPYIGVEWTGKFGQTANFARSAGESTRETKFVAGVSFRF
ncbi:copper resistance protein B, partial [Advenella sp. FME57]|uniref:copper resistance protein B n=1 Tax=Advenella sp. FME57 TaxID=2742604 RepID=UPI00351CB65E